MEKRSIILVTGATAGIGRHAALHLANEGHHVIATGRSETALASLRGEPVGRGRLDTLRLDVTDAGSIAAAVQAVATLTAGHGLDVLVNNAGYGHAGALADLTDGELRAQFDTNVFGLMAVTRAFLPAMQARGAGRIVNVSSIGGRLTFPMFGAYHASKYALEALSDALRQELGAFGIGVSIVEPGPIRSDFGKRSMETVGQVGARESAYAPIYARAQAIQDFADRQSVGPEATSRAIARAALSRRPRARYVTPRRVVPMLWLEAILPARAWDFLVTRVIGLTAKNVRGPRAATVPATVARQAA